MEVARTEQELAVQLAGRQKEISVAQKEAERAKAEQQALQATAEREKANQQVVTVNHLAQAERKENKRLIAARQEIEQGRLRSQTGADVEAYMRVKQDEAELVAAQKQAEAKQRLAEAEAQAKELTARGERALQMVSVDMAREQVNVEQAKVDVERKELQNRQEFAEAGIRLEVQKLTIQAERDVQVEFARALANFLANGHMTLYGTPETATLMLDNMAKGFGLRSAIEGFLNGADRNGHNGLTELTAQLGQLLNPALAKLKEKGEQPLDVSAFATALSESPEFLKSLRAAIENLQEVSTGKKPSSPKPQEALPTEAVATDRTDSASPPSA